MASRSIDLISTKTNCTCSTLFFLISQKKKQICTCSTLFVFLCRCFAQLQRCFVGLKRQTSQLHYRCSKPIKLQKFLGLSAGTGKLCIFGHLGLVFIWSCFVSCLLLLLYYVICAPVLTEGTKFLMQWYNCDNSAARKMLTPVKRVERSKLYVCFCRPD